MLPNKSINEQLLIFGLFVIVSIVISFLFPISRYITLTLGLAFALLFYSLKLYSKFILKLRGKTMYRSIGVK